MAFSPEAVADRRRLLRRVTVWRSLAALAAALAVVAWAGAAGLGGVLAAGGDKVAVLDVKGVIVSDALRLNAIDAATEDDAVKAIVVRIDSPGGTFVGSDDLHGELRKAAAKKPVVAVINDVAASGGYMTAIAADHILARRGSITASVGVVFETPRIERLMERVGVDMDSWRSGELKAKPTPFEAPSEAVDAQAQAMVDELHGMFVEMVQARRDLSADALAEIADGRVVTGQRALELGLIDGHGDVVAARAWLEAERGVSKDLPEVEITPPDPVERRGLLARAAALVFGETPALAEFGAGGMMAIWRPLSSGPALR